MNNHGCRLFICLFLVFLCPPVIGMQHKKPANIPLLNLPQTAIKPTKEMARRYGYCASEYSDSDDSNSEDINHVRPTALKTNFIKKTLSPKDEEELKLAHELSIVATTAEEQARDKTTENPSDWQQQSYYDLFIEKRKSWHIDKQVSHHNASALFTPSEQAQAGYKVQSSRPDKTEALPALNQHQTLRAAYFFSSITISDGQSNKTSITPNTDSRIPSRSSELTDKSAENKLPDFECRPGIRQSISCEEHLSAQASKPSKVHRSESLVAMTSPTPTLPPAERKCHRVTSEPVNMSRMANAITQIQPRIPAPRRWANQK